MEPTTRAQFKDYILRRLGAPVQQINVADIQVEDRIDDALAFFKDFHYLASEKTYYAHTVTEEDKTKGYLTVPENIIAVTSVLPSGEHSMNFTSDTYQAFRDIYSNINNSTQSLIPYYVGMHRLAEIEYWFSVTPSINYNKYKNQISFTDKTQLVVGNKIVMEVQAMLDPAEFKKMWSDRWLKSYATALVKKQWGENLKPFVGVQLLGGISLDGKTIYDEAVEEIRLIEEKMISSNSYIILDEIG